jgi:hypothetical protein
MLNSISSSSFTFSAAFSSLEPFITKVTALGWRVLLGLGATIISGSYCAYHLYRAYQFTFNLQWKEIDPVLKNLIETEISLDDLDSNQAKENAAETPIEERLASIAYSCYDSLKSVEDQIRQEEPQDQIADHWKLAQEGIEGEEQIIRKREIRIIHSESPDTINDDIDNSDSEYFNYLVFRLSRNIAISDPVKSQLLVKLLPENNTINYRKYEIQERMRKQSKEGVVVSPPIMEPTFENAFFMDLLTANDPFTIDQIVLMKDVLVKKRMRDKFSNPGRYAIKKFINKLHKTEQAYDKQLSTKNSKELQDNASLVYTTIGCYLEKCTPRTGIPLLFKALEYADKDKHLVVMEKFCRFDLTGLEESDFEKYFKACLKYGTPNQKIAFLTNTNFLYDEQDEANLMRKNKMLEEAEKLLSSVKEDEFSDAYKLIVRAYIKIDVNKAKDLLATFPKKQAKEHLKKAGLGTLSVALSIIFGLVL